MARRVVPLTPERRDDFVQLHLACGGRCFCAAWWTPDWESWPQRSAAENRQLRDALFARGEWDGYLAYEGDAPVGWAQVGPRDRLRKLVAQYGLAPDPQAWAVTCFLVAPGHRRHGVARDLLAGIIADLTRRGAARLEAFPKTGAADADELWNGPEPLFGDAGFRLVGRHPRGPRLVLDLVET